MRVSPQLDGKQLRAWIQADEQLAPLAVDLRGDTIGERRRRRLRTGFDLLLHRRRLVLAAANMVGRACENRGGRALSETAHMEWYVAAGGRRDPTVCRRPGVARLAAWC
jgi:hypothetical protein